MEVLEQLSMKLFQDSGRFLFLAIAVEVEERSLKSLVACVEVVALRKGKFSFKSRSHLALMMATV